MVLTNYSIYIMQEFMKLFNSMQQFTKELLE